MSGLSFNTLQGINNNIRIDESSTLYAPGHIVQVKFSVSQAPFRARSPSNNSGMRGSSFAQGSNQGGTIIRPLDVSITPRSINSWMHIEFNLFYEAHHNVLFNILKDGTLLGANYFGSDVHQGRWTGLGVAYYDNNESSTPMNMSITWFDRPGTLSPITYSLATITSNNTNRDIVVNTTFGSGNEYGVSFGTVQEIAN